MIVMLSLKIMDQPAVGSLLESLDFEKKLPSLCGADPWVLVLPKHNDI